VPVERLDVAAFSRRVLQRNIEHDRIDADVAERKILRVGGCCTRNDPSQRSEDRFSFDLLVF
jgi:hypothetical protein